MNYNANTGPLPANFGKKVKRVSDVNAMGYSPYAAPNQPQNVYPNLPVDADIPRQNPNFQQGYGNQLQYELPQQYAPGAASPGSNFNSSVTQQGGQSPDPFAMAANLAVLGQPVVQDMAMQYGQQLAGAGKTIIKQEMEKYVPVSKLKYYFAVDTKYVVSKLALLFFPFTHSDWSVKYDQNNPVQPRYEINAPDLYIPSMAYITYVLVAGLVLGMQDKFSPEQLGITASSALAWWIIELAVYNTTLYVLQMETGLKTLDLLAYSGYKFVGTIASILVTAAAGRVGFYASLVYVNLALAFFLVRSMKVQVLGAKYNVYYGGGGAEVSSQGHKRRSYFLLFVAVVQSALSWWLSFHLVPGAE